MFFLWKLQIFLVFCLFATVFAVLNEVNDDAIGVLRNIQMTGFKDGGIEIVLKTKENVTYFAIQYNVTRTAEISLLVGNLFDCGQLILQDDKIRVVEGDLIEYSYSLIIGNGIYYSDYKIYVIDTLEQKEELCCVTRDLRDNLRYLTKSIEEPIKEFEFYDINPGYSYKYDAFRNGIELEEKFQKIDESAHEMTEKAKQTFEGIVINSQDIQIKAAQIIQKEDPILRFLGSRIEELKALKSTIFNLQVNALNDHRMLMALVNDRFLDNEDFMNEFLEIIQLN